MEAKTKTIINLYFIDCKKINTFSEIRFEISKKTVKISDSIAKIEIENECIPLDCKYYFYEKFRLISSNRTTVPFNVSIYINETNNLIVFINEDSNFSFEIIYYDKFIKKLPEEIILEKYKAYHYDNFGLDSCRRFNLINCPKNYLRSVDSNIIINPDYLKGSFLITIDKVSNHIKVFKIGREYYSSFISDLNIDDIPQRLIDVQKFFEKYISSKFSSVQDEYLLKFNQKLKQGKKLNEAFIETMNFPKEDMQNMDKYFFLMRRIIANNIIKLKEKFSNKHLLYSFNYLLLKFFMKCKNKNEYNTLCITFLEFYNYLLSVDRLNIEQKINILFFYFETKTYTILNDKDLYIRVNSNNFDNEHDNNSKCSNNLNNIKIVTNNYNINDEYDRLYSEIEQSLNNEEKKQVEELKKYNRQKLKQKSKNNEFEEPTITFIQDCVNNSPYSNAFDLLNKIIENIKSTSKLFELLFLVASGTGNNKLEKEITYKFSLLSEKKIKEMLIDALPTFILRESNNNNYNAYYSPSTRILMINENNAFGFSLDEGNKVLVSGKDLDGKYTIPILILLMHELFGHANRACRVKTKLGKEYSPTNISFKKNGKFINYFIESGRVVEFYISQFKEVILYLKFSGDYFPELLIYDKWIGPDFDELNKLVIKKIILSNFNSKNYVVTGFPVPFEINDEPQIDDSDKENNFVGKEYIDLKTDYFRLINDEKEFGCI